MRATELAHLMMRQSIKPGDWVLDATVGNGHDTLFLAELVGPSGRVFGFDVQEAALEATARRVANLPQVELILAGHEKLAESLAAVGFTEGQDQLAGIMFNLGYLPGASKTIMTYADTTLTALRQALVHLRVQGIATLVCYPGHSGGIEETTAVQSYAERLPSAFSVSRYHRLNAIQASPQLLVVNRIRASSF